MKNNEEIDGFEELDELGEPEDEDNAENEEPEKAENGSVTEDGDKDTVPDNEVKEEAAAEDNGGDIYYEPIIGSYTHDDIFEKLIDEARRRSEEKARISAEKAAAEDEEIFIAGDGSESENDDRGGEEFDGYDDDNGGDLSDGEEEAPDISVSVNDSLKKKKGFSDRLKKTEVLKPDVIKDMFFGSGRSEADHDGIFTPDGSGSEEDYDDEDIEDPIALDRRSRRRVSADPDKEKMIFSVDYMLTPDQALDGYMLFYNEFIKKKNIKITLVLGIISLVFLFAVIISPKGYLNYMLLLITLSIVAMRWINSESAKRDALLSAEDVKNDSYRLDFYNSRILLKASELAGDKIYNYPPVMIRFEDIDLKVLDYEEIYVLIFKKSYVYTIPKSAMNEEQNRVFGGLLENILGDDYCEFYSRERAANEKAEKRRNKRRGSMNREKFPVEDTAEDFSEDIDETDDIDDDTDE